MRDDVKDRHIADLEEEIKRLEAWKAEATLMMRDLDTLRSFAAVRGVKLGKSIASEVLRLWREDIQKCAAMEQALNRINSRMR